MLTLSVVNWDTWDNSFYVSIRKGNILLIILMTRVMCLYFSMHEEDILEHTNVKCHLCTLQLTCRPWCNIDIHLLTIEHTHAKVLVNEYERQESQVTLTVKLFVINVTLQTPHKHGKWHYYACDIEYHKRCSCYCAPSSNDEVYLSPKFCVAFSTLINPRSVLLSKDMHCNSILLTSSMFTGKSSIRCLDIRT